jgi:hypothetical protein
MSQPIAYKSVKGNARQRRTAVRKFKRSYSAFRVEPAPEYGVSQHRIFLDSTVLDGEL